MLKKNPALWSAVLLTALFVALAFFQVDFLESLELKTYDLRMRLRAGGPETRTDIAVVEIDDDSITKLGRWPWPRALVGRMVERLKAQGASLIGLNVMFSEPATSEGLKQIRLIQEAFEDGFAAKGGVQARQFIQMLEESQAALDYDQALADAIAAAGNVVLPVFFELGEYFIDPADGPKLGPVIERNALVQAQGQGQGYMIPAGKVTMPIDIFSQPSLGLGHINTLPDADGAVRREVLLIDYRTAPFPSYALRLAMLAKGIRLDSLSLAGQEGLSVGGKLIPTNPNYDFFVTFTDSQAFPRFSFFDVLNDKVDPSAFKGRIVLIGVTATGVDIPQVTPIDPAMSTVMFSANVLQNIMKGGFIVRTGMMNLIELAVLLAIGLFLALLLPRLKARGGAIVSAVLLIAVAGTGVYLFLGLGLWYKITYPILLVILGYAVVITTRYFVTEVVKEKVEGESAEINRMLGLNFQQQGQLDLAFDKFRRVPVDQGMKDILWNLALDYERKRMFNKAVNVYEYIKGYDPGFRDITAKIKKLNVASETMIFGMGASGSTADDGTMVFDENTRPTLGRYEVIKELGRGAMGIVYQGKDPRINRVTAIKTVRFSEEYEPDEAVKVKEQFFREAETAGILSHPNIVTIYDAGEDHDMSYIAMEFLEGHDLKEHTAPETLLPVPKVLALIADVADALGYAHSKGVVHRDIKPANLMILNSGVVKVTDFGIARATASSKTKTGVVKGTPFYMSPEQIKGEKVDGRSDIFSLGVVLYEMLCGTQPFRADDLTSLIFKITADDPEPVTVHNPRVPAAVSQIIDKALVKDREKRYQKAENMARHLRQVLAAMQAKKGA